MFDKGVTQKGDSRRLPLAAHLPYRCKIDELRAYIGMAPFARSNEVAKDSQIGSFWGGLLTVRF
jgi:hypothetical protein